jgi:hypothetical protein
MRSIGLTATLQPGARVALEAIRPDAVAASLDEVGNIIARWKEGPAQDWS